MASTRFSTSPVALRLKQLRVAMGIPSSAAMARKLEISVQHWNNIENGLPLSYDVALKIVTAFPGVTFDWLYHGKRDRLSKQVAELLS
jgi:DNA-binding XRE family transcriptional regulator